MGSVQAGASGRAGPEGNCGVHQHRGDARGGPPRGTQDRACTSRKGWTEGSGAEEPTIHSRKDATPDHGLASWRGGGGETPSRPQGSPLDLLLNLFHQQ